MNKQVKFGENQAAAFAEFLATLVKQGIEYRIISGIDCWTVELTGGF